MQLSIYIIDAFTCERFKGNQAAVVPLQQWLPDATLQAIAAENNLSETAYVVLNAQSNVYHNPNLYLIHLKGLFGADFDSLDALGRTILSTAMIEGVVSHLATVVLPRQPQSLPFVKDVMFALVFLHNCYCSSCS